MGNSAHVQESSLKQRMKCFRNQSSHQNIYSVMLVGADPSLTVFPSSAPSNASVCPVLTAICMGIQRSGAGAWRDASLESTFSEPDYLCYASHRLVKSLGADVCSWKA